MRHCSMARKKRIFRSGTGMAFFLSLCVFLLSARYGYSQDTLDEPEFPGNMAWDDPVSRGLGANLRHGLMACGVSLLSNGVLTLFNAYVTRMPWALPSAASVRRNFTTPWKWEDTDGFLVNHFGHPVQGMIYFGAGRANGFGFYGSIFFAAFGSAAWELFGESQLSSINDFYTTVPAGIVLGEITYRLFLQARAAGIPMPLAFLINPAAGFQSLVTGWEPPRVENNFYDMRVYLAAAFGSTYYSVSGSGGHAERFFHRGPLADVGFRIVYGDPFVQNTWVPFRHFELATSFGMDLGNHKDFRIFADGYLFSFSPLHTERTSLSTGLSLHMDFASIGQHGITDGTIDMYSSALGWTAKHRQILLPGVGPETIWRTSTHAGFTFFGASKFHYPAGRPRRPDYGDDRLTHELNNFGFGFNLKHSSGLEIGRRSRIDVSGFHYVMWPFPGTSELTQGFTRWRFFDVSFSHLVSRRISLGTIFSRVRERGSFEGFPDTRKDHWSVRTFVAWNGNQPLRHAGGR